ncbi:MAG: hypothetical protein ACRDMX_10175 [Solirubrobacteraceae bacterium]
MSAPGATQPRGALLVGSVPLDDTEQVLRVAARELGDHLARIPDGETGERAGWVAWQGQNFKLRGLRVVAPAPGQYPPTPRFAPVSDAVDLAGLQFGSLGFAQAALDGWRVFEALHNDGVIAPGTRFQVSLPTPLAPVAMFVVDEHRAALAPAYEAAMRRELARIVSAIPAQRLAIQWDICIEVWIWERWLTSPWDDVEEGLVAAVARAGSWVPAGAQLGHHYCYGDFRHEHFNQPRDAAVMVAMANRMVAATPRRVDWVHLPVPIERTDDAFYAPLARLRLEAGTDLHLGLIHSRDGVPGARLRVARALAHVPAFGVACECGMGRRPAGRGGDEAGIVGLLRTHAAVAAPIR